MRRLVLLLLLAAPAWGADSINDKNEGDSAKCAITFVDENGAALNPDLVTWKVTAAEDGRILLGPTTVVSPGTTWTFTCLTPAATMRGTSPRPGSSLTRKIETAFTWETMTKTKEWSAKVNLHQYPPLTPQPTATP